jgi:hypothetical protein
MRKIWFESDEFRLKMHNRTLLLTCIPDYLKSKDDIGKYILKAHPSGNIQEVLMGRHVRQLPEMIAEHEKYMQLLENALLLYLKNPNKLPDTRPTHYEGWPLFGEKVDTIDYCTKKLQSLEERIYFIRSKGDSSYELDSSAFVSFGSVIDAYCAASKLSTIFKNPILTPNAKVSPHFEEIVWENVGLSAPMRKSRALFAFTLLVTLTICWTWLCTFVSGMASLDNIAQVSENLAKFITRNRALAVLVQHILGPLIMAILNYFLPSILRVIARIQGVNSLTGIEKSVLHKLFFFLLYQFVILLVFAPIINGAIAFAKGERFTIGNESEPLYKGIIKLAAQGFVNV